MGLFVYKNSSICHVIIPNKAARRHARCNHDLLFIADTYKFIFSVNAICHEGFQKKGFYIAVVLYDVRAAACKLACRFYQPRQNRWRYIQLFLRLRRVEVKFTRH